MSNNNKTIVNLAESLALSNRMRKGFTITGEHIGPVNYTVWCGAIRKLQAEAYGIVRIAHNDDLTKADVTIDKNGLYGAIREVLAMVGEVNGHKLMCNEAFAISVMTEATRTVDEYHGKALTVKSQLSNVKKQLKDIEDVTEGINKEYRESLVKREAELSDELEELKKLPDMVTVRYDRVSDKVFKSAVEHILGEIVSGQKMKSWDELEEELKAKKAERNAKNRERAKAKKAEAAKTEAESK